MELTQGKGLEQQRQELFGMWLAQEVVDNMVTGHFVPQLIYGSISMAVWHDSRQLTLDRGHCEPDFMLANKLWSHNGTQ